MNEPGGAGGGFLAPAKPKIWAQPLRQIAAWQFCQLSTRSNILSISREGNVGQTKHPPSKPASSP